MIPSLIGNRVFRVSTFVRSHRQWRRPNRADSSSHHLGVTVTVGGACGCCWLVTTTASSGDRRNPFFLKTTRLDNNDDVNNVPSSTRKFSKSTTDQTENKSPLDWEALWKKYVKDRTSFLTKKNYENLFERGEETTAGVVGASSSSLSNTTPASWDDFYRSFTQDLMTFVTGNANNASSDQSQDAAIQELVARVRARTTQKGGEVEDKSSFPIILSLFNNYVGDLQDLTNDNDNSSSSDIRQELNRVVDKYIGKLDLSKIFPTSLLYYMEYEDERKNPSWKRRMHRYNRGIDLTQLDELNQTLKLAHLCYADSTEQIERELGKRGYELVAVDLTSSPGRPAYYVAVRRTNPSNAVSSLAARWSSSASLLPVIIGVRGTKTVADAVTDVLCDSVDYRGGKAHAYILTSGRYVVEKTASLLQELSALSGKKLDVTLVGHSLGAGAASIAGMELAEYDQYNVQVFGFGCPAVLSKELAEQSSSLITTIINDADVVPRMSGASVANLVMEVMEFDWLPYAKKDVQHALDEFFSPQVAQSVLQTIEPHLETFARSTIQPTQGERLTPELYPPGRCIHFYADGSGKSAAVVPNDFFKEIDLSRRMIDDHKFFSGYQKMMLDVVRDAKHDHHFRFDDDE